MLLDHSVNVGALGSSCFGGYAKDVIGKATGLVVHIFTFRPKALAHFFRRLFAHLRLKKHLQHHLPRFAARAHYLFAFFWPMFRARLTISTALMAASNPLLPCFSPARSTACSKV